MKTELADHLAYLLLGFALVRITWLALDLARIHWR